MVSPFLHLETEKRIKSCSRKLAGCAERKQDRKTEIAFQSRLPLTPPANGRGRRESLCTV